MGSCLPHRQGLTTLVATLVAHRMFRPLPRLLARLDMAARPAAAAVEVVPRVIPGRTTPAVAAVAEEAVGPQEAEDLRAGPGQVAAAAEDIRLPLPRARMDHRAAADHLTVAVARLAAGETSPSTGRRTLERSHTGMSGRRTWYCHDFPALRDFGPG